MNTRKVSVSAIVPAPRERIFELLVDPTKHPLIDGSGTVRAALGTLPKRLTLGSSFGMDMKMGVPYKIRNTVVEFEENRLIAWRHLAGHRWRWELRPVNGDTGEQHTEVTETFDWSTSPMGFSYPLIGFPRRNRKAIIATLERLKQVLDG